MSLQVDQTWKSQPRMSLPSHRIEFISLTQIWEAIWQKRMYGVTVFDRMGQVYLVRERSSSLSTWDPFKHPDYQIALKRFLVGQ